MAPWRRSSSASTSTSHAGGNTRVSPDTSADSLAGEVEGADEERWSALMPDLLGDILLRVEASSESWPQRQDLVVCASVCRWWRDVAVSVVRPPLESGRITFLSSLKQPGQRNAPVHCYIKWNKKMSTFSLYLELTQELTDNGKFLLAAQKFRCGMHTEYIISLDSDSLLNGSRSYVGKIKSNFIRTKFSIYDSQPPYEGAKLLSSRLNRWFGSKHITPLVSPGDFEVGHVSYECTLGKSRRPRRMHCAIQCPLVEGATLHSQEAKKLSTPSTLVLDSKVPRWHENLHCWSLNFHGRALLPSVKNFQLIVPVGTGEPWRVMDETVILQLGKIEDGFFTMDYRYPLSAFQAFAICLSTFGKKMACE